MKSDKGILTKIPGKYIAEALNSLPECRTVSDDTVRFTSDIPDFGRVRITFKRVAKTRLFDSDDFWIAVHAAKAE